MSVFTPGLKSEPLISFVLRGPEAQAKTNLAKRHLLPKIHHTLIIMNRTDLDDDVTQLERVQMSGL